MSEPLKWTNLLRLKLLSFDQNAESLQDALANSNLQKAAQVNLLID